jgi:ParB-like chromosome segregation protein Spo0J
VSQTLAARDFAESDEMPAAIKNLNDRDALEAALVAAKDYRQQPPIELKLPDYQGCYALTFAVKYADNTESI